MVDAVEVRVSLTMEEELSECLVELGHRDITVVLVMPILLHLYVVEVAVVLEE